MQNEFTLIETNLSKWKNNIENFNEIRIQCEKLRIKFQKENKENEANRAWLYREIANAHILYNDAFQKLKKRIYYQAWCLLEQIEIILRNIKENFPIHDDMYGLIFLTKTVKNFQTLFPYRIFFSGRYLVKTIVCSICGEKKILGGKCKHRLGKLYNGELCYHIIKDFEIITFDAVQNPVNKCAVPFMQNEYVPNLKDNYVYTYLEITLRLLSSPYDDWSLIKEKTYVKPERKISPDELCPCMQSLKSYAECCMKKPGIEMTHIIVDSPLSPQEVAHRVNAEGPLKHFSSVDPIIDYH